MQLCRYQWNLGSIRLGGSARSLRCSSLKVTYRFQSFPARITCYSDYRSSKANQPSCSSVTGVETGLQEPASIEWTTASTSVPGIRRVLRNYQTSANTKWVSSAQALRQYLGLQTVRQRSKYWISVRDKVQRTELPAILVQFMHATTSGQPREAALDDRCKAKLSALGLDSDDLAHWAWILAPNNPDDVVERFTSTSQELPIFLLFVVLRGEMQKVRSLKLLLVYTWDCLMELARPNSPTAIHAKNDIFHSAENRSVFRKHGLDEGAFDLLIGRLLYHTRRLWPSAMLTVSNLVEPYLHAFMKKSLHEKSGNLRKHSRASAMNNRFIRLLALPASIDPLKSMSHNWTAQRVLLKLAGEFRPSLTLDKDSYEAVISVLTALKKSNRESKVASLRSRSWPPWRIDQDGMDAERSPEDDQSRATSAIISSKEAGYSGNLFDETMSIFSGQEPDGTPTIQTRKEFKARNAHRQLKTDTNDLDPLLWAARIESTRDVAEAWGAFLSFQEKGGQASQNVYLPMFEKIEAESKRLGRSYPTAPRPGDGKEVLPVSDDNFSEFYKQRLQPPSLEHLYRQMVESGFPPKGRCLKFLVHHARTLDEGLNYLQDSGIDQSIMASLLADPNEDLPTGILEKVSLPIFASIIHLLCRFAPRAISIDEFGLSENDFQNYPNGKLDSEGRKWIIRKIRSQDLLYQSRPLNPLHQAAFLLKQRKPSYRPAWYALFKGLGTRHLLISPSWDEIANNDEMAWKVVVAALNEFHACGLELDPYGFLLICTVFDKYARDYFSILKGRPSEPLEASRVLKVEFEKMTETVADASDILPLFMHSIHGAHLHAYVRCMGLVRDYTEILSMLRWMVKYHQELQHVATRSENGPRLLRHTLTAARVFIGGTLHEQEAKELVESVASWDGWPSDVELQLYNKRNSYHKDSADEIDDTDEMFEEGQENN